MGCEVEGRRQKNITGRGGRELQLLKNYDPSKAHKGGDGLGWFLDKNREEK